MGYTPVVDPRVFAELSEQGFAVVDGFLPDFARLTLLEDLDRRGAQLRRAAVGRAGGGQVQQAVRRDAILWLEEGDGSQEYWRRLGNLREDLNRRCFLNLTGFEGHYAVYSPGAFYRRHRDRFSSAPQDRVRPVRAVSTVTYLDESWMPEHGGALRLYPEGRPAVDILPAPGRLVVFLSDELDHEVLLTHRPRHTLTGWFLR